MNMENDLILKECATAWLHAGDELGIRVTAPKEILDGSNNRIFAAYLLDFGSLNGCYLYPVESLAHSREWIDIHTWAITHQQYVSFIKADEYRTYERERFIEALTDWGYFGPDSLRPIWLR